MKKAGLNKEAKAKVKARLNDEAKAERVPLVVGTVAMLASSLANQALPKLLGRLLDEKSCNANQTCSTASGSLTAATTLGFVVVSGGFASFLRTTMLNQAQDNIAQRLRTKLFSAVLKDRDMEWFISGGKVGKDTKAKGDGAVDVDAPSSSPGAISAILTEDVNKASESVTTVFANLLRSCSSFSFATYHMLMLNPTLFGLSVSVVPVIGTAAIVLNKFVKKVTSRQRECIEHAAAFAEERITNIEAVKLSNREKDEVQKYIHMQEESVQLGRKASVAKGSFMGFMFASAGGALYAVFNAGGKAVADGRMTNGELTSFATYSFLLGLGTSGIFRALGESTQGLVCADRVFRMMDGPAKDESEEKLVSSARKSTDVDEIDSICFENVSFAYKSSPEKTVLKDVSFEIQKGQVVCIVGKNGSGKSTIGSILAGLLLPRDGSITLKPSGTDFNELEREAQTSLVQVIPQHPALFDASIRENVAYSNPGASDEAIKEVLEIANCNDFISKHDEGINFRVGRNGMKLSGGQRQRLALARALLGNPGYMILDEPASALDKEGEQALVDAIHACKNESGGKRRGLLLITHKTSTLRTADLVVVLKDGQIEKGTFADLSQNRRSSLRQLMPELEYDS
ncbi:hypothetical protein THAOC_00151 [Thalassiosira oceanica]|uniref:ABC transporter n=1 Tax=Thalassiosira oceanica TaxID=159749 RepID=K0TJV9_THAOC|nr:hypothetical protein THAOC_00151 [Thalassiosira oceanica]|eukprot:EJK77975.1 hypothetical protein THAOC_00151 [Thalassiosira oceanica]